MKKVFRTILLNRELNKKMLAVLVDPDKCKGSLLANTVAALKTNTPDFIFVGGSLTSKSSESLIDVLKEETTADIVLFPGNTSQFAPNADAMLFMSLISGRNPDYLIGQQVNSAIAVKQSGIEVISTGYILIEGQKQSAVEYISNTRPIPPDKKDIVLATTIAGELLGMRAIYLEAGSGAASPIPTSLVKHISENIEVPLIAGGGITQIDQMLECFKAGADIVVIGTLFETEPHKIPDFVTAAANYSELPDEE
jgi:putative glycerol-1-phosphate prenyltransferase